MPTFIVVGERESVYPGHVKSKRLNEESNEDALHGKPFVDRREFSVSSRRIRVTDERVHVTDP